MSTHDVPGANPVNADVLKAGCWAEHQDGSLIYVKGTENGRVVYEIYDMAHDPPAVYTDAMLEDAFKKAFSFPPIGTADDEWVWHDKTPFDWKRVMRMAERPRPGYTSAAEQMSAAARVAESLNLRGRKVMGDFAKHRSEEEVQGSAAKGIWDRIDRAMREFLG